MMTWGFYMNYGYKRFSVLVVLVCVIYNFPLSTSPATQLASDTDITPGKKQLETLLRLHRAGVPEDFSLKYNENIKGYRAHIKEKMRLLEGRVQNNLHRDAMDIFNKSSWFAEQCTPKDSPVCVGTQLLQDLDVMGGKPGSETIYLASKLALARSSFGKVSAAFLLAQPESNVAVLLKRQKAIKAIVADHTVQERLDALYTEFVSRECFMLPVLNADRAFENRNFNLGLLLLELPGLRELKKNPWVRTID